MDVNNKILILGSSSISKEQYHELACAVGKNFEDGKRASNPEDTAEFVQSIKDNPNKDQMIYDRAIGCIKDAEYIIVDLSAPSTGMGLEVAHLILDLPKSGKIISFIAKEGAKLPSHILGMYKSITGKEAEVKTYAEPMKMFSAVQETSSYDEYLERKKEVKR